MKTLTASERLDRTISEKELLEFVRDAAALHGWLVFHDHDSRRSNPGFPDIVLCRGGQVIFSELKREVGGRVSQVQQQWLDELGKCEGISVYLWKPSDMNRILEILK